MTSAEQDVRRPATAARAWHVAIVVIGLFAVVGQLLLVVRGVDVLVDTTGRVAPGGERVLRFFSYFTIQSNLLSIVTSAMLAVRPDRDGRVWRVVRLDAVVGMTVTLIVYAVALAPYLDLSGFTWLTDVLFHFVMPGLTILGWLLFEPAERITWSTAFWALLWPLAYVVYILVLGAISDWYPYPFVDVTRIGYLTAARNGVVVVVLILAVSALYGLLDNVLPRARRRREQRA